MEGAPWAIMLGVSFIKVLGVSDGILAVSDSKRMDYLVRSGTGRSTAEQIGLNMQYISGNSASFPPGGNASHLPFH